MAQVYKFLVSMPVFDMLPRNRMCNVLHFSHAIGGVDKAGLETFAQDLIDLYQAKYNNTGKEVECKVYELGAPPQYPVAKKVSDPGIPWTCVAPPEVALCLSYAGDNRGDKSRRGRMYLMPQINSTVQPASLGVRPGSTVMDWALTWYTASNASLPDLGGPDWTFGIWSKTYSRFTKAEQAWVNDEWDTQRRRQLRETTRVAAVREG